jgi:hypothetical protein
MKFRFKRKRYGEWRQAELKDGIATCYCDAFHIYDKNGNRLAIVHKHRKSRHIEIILNEGYYIQSASHKYKFKEENISFG